jgi:hypothetical protein
MLIRWFYVSNWGRLQNIDPESKGWNSFRTAQEYIDSVCDWYAPAFKEKAIFEVIDGSKVTYQKADGTVLDGYPF